MSPLSTASFGPPTEGPMPASPMEGVPSPSFPVDSSESPEPPTEPSAKGTVLFEDYFPPLDLTADQKEGLALWFKKDLKKCVKNVEAQRDRWAMYRAVFMLEYVEKFYPTLDFSAAFPSGLLMEKVLEAMDRIRKSVFSPRPLFVVDDRTSNLEDISLIHRMEWFMQTVLTVDLDIQRVIGLDGIFEFLLDGSFILEADQMYERVPQRTIKTYSDTDELMMDEDKVVNKADFDEAVVKLGAGGLARVLVEESIITKNGLQFFKVEKEDHLIPPNVYSDEDIRFRARRMYLTKADMELMASEDVNWYNKADVKKVIESRQTARSVYRSALNGGGDLEVNSEALAVDTDQDLCYDWRREEANLNADPATVPYKDTWAVYRIFCKYAYKTSSDSKGLIPKYCTFDYEPESGTILRARTYPHFEERRNYFHFKLSYAPKSYWGLGFGTRMLPDDSLASNAISLFMDGTAMSTFRPMVTVHPEQGGYMPFPNGYGPLKVGYVRATADIKWDEIPPPPMTLLTQILPLARTGGENKTSITSLTQGRTESSDPRSPAQKTQLLLREAEIGIDSMLEDWDMTGWEPMAQFIWMAKYENLVYEGEDSFDDKIEFPGIGGELEEINKITAEELQKKVRWKSQASADYLNSELREQRFLRHFQFIAPLLERLSVINPPLYKKYFLRWLHQAGQELDIRGFKSLIPSGEELAEVPPEEMQTAIQGMMNQVVPGQSPGTTDVNAASGS